MLGSCTLLHCAYARPDQALNVVLFKPFFAAYALTEDYIPIRAQINYFKFILCTIYHELGILSRQLIVQSK